jgi:hypothetical protein
MHPLCIQLRREEAVKRERMLVAHNCNDVFLACCDREREQERLRELAEDPSPQMALLYGRRRIGKTYLLTHLWSADQAFYSSMLWGRNRLVRAGEKDAKVKGKI